MKKKGLIKGIAFPLLALSMISCGKISEEEAQAAIDKLLNDNSAPEAQSNALTGTAATGAPIAGGEVRVKCNSGTNKSGTTDSYGKWSIGVSDCNAPFLVQVRGSVNGKPVNIMSAADEADVGAIVNVTPLTHVIVAQVLGNADADDIFDNVAIASITKTKIKEQEVKIKAKLKQIIQAVTGETDMSKIDLMNTPFATDHDGLDGVLDMVELSVDGSGQMNLEAVDGTAIIANHDPSTDIGSVEVAVDTTKIAAVKTAYGEFDTLLAGLIAYVKANATTISTSQQIGQLPAGYTSYYASDFKDEGNDAQGALQQWFGLKGDMKDFNEMLAGKEVSFANVKLELDSGSSTAGTIFFDFIVAGKAEEKGIDLRVKKESAGWRLHGDQSNYSIHLGVRHQTRIAYSSGTTTSEQDGVVLELSLGDEENATINFGTVRKARIKNASGTVLTTFDLTFSDHNGDGTQDTWEEDGIDATTGNLVGRYHGNIEITDLTFFTGSHDQYTIELLDASNAVQETYKEYLPNPANFSASFPAMSFSAGATTADIDLTDLGNFCTNTEKSFSIAMPSLASTDFELQYFGAGIYDDNSGNARAEVDFDDSANGSMSVDGSNSLSGTVMGKDFHIYLEDRTDVNYSMDIRCN